MTLGMSFRSHDIGKVSCIGLVYFDRLNLLSQKGSSL